MRLSAKLRENRGRLRHLHQAEHAFLHPRAARCRHENQGKLRSTAFCPRRAIFSPTTDPIDPPMNAKSITPRQNGSSRSWPVKRQDRVAFAGFSDRLCPGAAGTRENRGIHRANLGFGFLGGAFIEKKLTYSIARIRRWCSQLGHTLRFRTNFSRMSVCPHFSHFSQASGGISCFSRRGCRAFFSLRNQAIREMSPGVGSGKRFGLSYVCLRALRQASESKVRRDSADFTGLSGTGVKHVAAIKPPLCFCCLTTKTRDAERRSASRTRVSNNPEIRPNPFELELRCLREAAARVSAFLEGCFTSTLARDAHEYPDREPAGEHERSTVAEERKRNSRNRHQVQVMPTFTRT
jgi:hypothetical protein